jgi:hypothetical protein
MYKEKAHQIDHEGISSTQPRSRQYIWIIKGKRLAEYVRMSCTQDEEMHGSVDGQLLEH